MKTRHPQFFLGVLAFLLLFATSATAGDYVGSKACGECHADQFSTFSRHSKKSHSRKSVEIMAPKLTPQELQGCYDCHTTGHGKGGFTSYEKTPELADVGCETCHGPGAKHAESGGDASLIARRPTIATCETCHNAERVAAFNYRPLLFSGAH